MTLSASPVAEANEVFIPIEDVAALLGYTCTYDAQTNIATIQSGNSDKEVK